MLLHLYFLLVLKLGAWQQHVIGIFQMKQVCVITKPTGESAPARLTRRANEVYEEILRKESAEAYGAAESSDCDSDHLDEDGCMDQNPDFMATQNLPAESSTEDASHVGSMMLRLPSAAVGKKRKGRDEECADNKSKNCRNANPRGGAASAINGLVNQIASTGNNNNNQMMQFMQMMMQQQAAQHQTMMMMLMMGRTPPSAPSSAAHSFSGSSFNSGTTDSTGDVSMSSAEIQHHFD